MARKSSGAGTKPISTAIDEKLYSHLQLLAENSGVKVGKYCRIVLEDAVKRGFLVVEETSYRIQSPSDLDYSTPDVLSLRAAEKPTQHAPRRSAGA
jgi:hypothetical protein